MCGGAPRIKRLSEAADHWLLELHDAAKRQAAESNFKFIFSDFAEIDLESIDGVSTTRIHLRSCIRILKPMNTSNPIRSWSSKSTRTFPPLPQPIQIEAST